MSIMWHPKRWWNFCVSKDGKKETEPIFTEGVLKHFASWGIKTFWNRKLCMNFLV